MSAVELVALSEKLNTSIADLVDPGDEPNVEVGESRWASRLVRMVGAGDVERVAEELSTSGDAIRPPRQLEEQLRTALRASRIVYEYTKTQLDEFDRKWGLDDSDLTRREHIAIAYADGPVEGAAANRIMRSARRTEIPVEVDARDVAAVAWRLWRSSYEDERERRVGAAQPADASDRARRARRGHVVRELDRELLEEMRRVLRLEGRD